MDVPDLRMRREELGERQPVGAVLHHPDRERLGPAQHQPRIERSQDRAGRVLHELQPLDVVVAHRDDDAAHAVAVAVQILRGAVDDEVGAELERALEVRARERVVDDEPDAVPVRDVGGRGGGRSAAGRVGRRLDEEHPGCRRERPLDRVEIAGVDVGEGEAVPASAPGRRAGTFRRTRCPTRRRDRPTRSMRRDGVDGRHARREGERRLAAFDGGEIRLDRRRASDCACARTRSPCACRARPGRTSTSGRSA